MSRRQSTFSRFVRTRRHSPQYEGTDFLLYWLPCASTVSLPTAERYHFLIGR